MDKSQSAEDQEGAEEGAENRVPVIILCGGKGTRLREETEYRPKPLVEVGGKPILWHVMKGYAQYGHTNFILCLGYKGGMIKEYFKDLAWRTNDFRLNTLTSHMDLLNADGMSEENWNIVFAETGLESLTGKRVKMAERYVKTDNFMMTYGDGLSDVNVESLVAFHKQQDTLITLTGIHPVSKYGVLEVENGKITKFREKPVLKDYINAGFMVMKREVFQHIDPEANTMLEDDWLPRLAEMGQVSLYPHGGFWHCMDTFKDYEDLNKMWQEGPRWKTWED